jgi:hypothetical protein
VSRFLSRWARLKARSAHPTPAPPDPVDPATLPALETLTGESDVTAFLAPGVPQALHGQALRIAWENDPRIAGFRGMADYDWDFNAEGYGRLAVADDVGALLRKVLTPAVPQPTPVAAIEAPPEPLPDPEPPRQVAAEQAEPPPILPARRHGGALPA